MNTFRKIRIIKRIDIILERKQKTKNLVNQIKAIPRSKPIVVLFGPSIAFIENASNIIVLAK